MSSTRQSGEEVGWAFPRQPPERIAVVAPSGPASVVLRRDSQVRVSELRRDIPQLDPGGEELRREGIAQVGLAEGGESSPVADLLPWPAGEAAAKIGLDLRLSATVSVGWSKTPEARAVVRD